MVDAETGRTEVPKRKDVKIIADVVARVTCEVRTWVNMVRILGNERVTNGISTSLLVLLTFDWPQMDKHALVH
jgi:hypothetical protein